jgi:hypothetical protein
MNTQNTIKTVWITLPTFTPAASVPELTASQKRAKRIITLIQSMDYAPTTAQILERLCITDSQFHNAKPFLIGYKRINLRWYPADRVEEAIAYHKAMRAIKTIGYNRTNYVNRSAKLARGVAA